MAIQLTAEDARESLTGHVTAKGVEIFMKYGPYLGWAELHRLLADDLYVRYPCEIVFDAGALLPGEFAQPIQKGERPEDGFTMFVHPIFMSQPERVPALVLYQLVAVNYGEFASHDEAELFGAAALGMTRDEYYALICECADQVGAGAATMFSESPDECAPGGCTCGA